MRLELLLHLSLLLEVLGPRGGHDQAGVTNYDHVPVRPREHRAKEMLMALSGAPTSIRAKLKKMHKLGGQTWDL